MPPCASMSAQCRVNPRLLLLQQVVANLGDNGIDDETNDDDDKLKTASKCPSTL